MRRTNLLLLSALVCALVCTFVVNASSPAVPTGTWLAVGTMAQARTGAAAAALPDGSVVVAGGTAPDGTVLSSVEIYAAGVFSAAAPMHAARTGHAAITLGDGRVLVTGRRNL